VEKHARKWASKGGGEGGGGRNDGGGRGGGLGRSVLVARRTSSTQCAKEMGGVTGWGGGTAL